MFADCKNLFDLVLNFLIAQNRFNEVGNWFQILLALYWTLLFPKFVLTDARWKFSFIRVLCEWTVLLTVK